MLILKVLESCVATEASVTSTRGSGGPQPLQVPANAGTDNSGTPSGITLSHVVCHMSKPLDNGGPCSHANCLPEVKVLFQEEVAKQVQRWLPRVAC